MSVSKTDAFPLGYTPKSSGWRYAPTNPTNTVQTLRMGRTLQQERFKFTEKRNRDEEIKKEIHFPHSLGLLYSAFTYFLGFKVNSGEFFLAERYFIRALIIKNHFAPSYSGLAEVNYLQNRLDNALKFSALAIQNSPHSPYHYQSRRALQLQAKGSMIEGWDLKEARLKLDHSIDHRGRPPRWEGQPLHKKSLLITACLKSCRLVSME